MTLCIFSGLELFFSWADKKWTRVMGKYETKPKIVVFVSVSVFLFVSAFISELASVFVSVFVSLFEQVDQDDEKMGEKKFLTSLVYYFCMRNNDM